MGRKMAKTAAAAGAAGVEEAGAAMTVAMSVNAILRASNSSRTMRQAIPAANTSTANCGNLVSILRQQMAAVMAESAL
jgi:hypothetical protein